MPCILAADVKGRQAQTQNGLGEAQARPRRSCPTHPVTHAMPPADASVPVPCSTHAIASALWQATAISDTSARWLCGAEAGDRWS